MALGVTRDETRDPLGILAVSTIVRGDERTDKMRDRNAKIRRDDRESLRWAKLVDEVSDRVCECSRGTNGPPRKYSTLPSSTCFEPPAKRNYLLTCLFEMRCTGLGSKHGRFEHALRRLSVVGYQEISRRLNTTSCENGLTNASAHKIKFFRPSYAS